MPPFAAVTAPCIAAVEHGRILIGVPPRDVDLMFPRDWQNGLRSRHTGRLWSGSGFARESHVSMPIVTLELCKSDKVTESPRPTQRGLVRN